MALISVSLSVQMWHSIGFALTHSSQTHNESQVVTSFRNKSYMCIIISIISMYIIILLS